MEPPSGAADPGYRTLPWREGLIRDSSQAIAKVRAYMTAAGCSTVVGPAPEGAVWVYAPPARAQRFDCGGIPADSAQGLARAYRELLAAESGGANVYSDPGYWEITSEQSFSCSGTEGYTITAGTPGSGRAFWVDVYLPDGSYYWSYYLEPGVPTTFILPTGCGWAEKVSAVKVGGSGPVAPEPGEFPNPGGGGSGSQYPTNTPRLLSIAVTPGALTIEVGAIAQFRAALTYDNGAIVESAGNVTWSSSSSIAAVDDYGTFQTLAGGTTTITASLGSVSGSATVELRPVCIPDTTAADSLLTVDPYPFPDSPELEICTGSGAAECMRNNPGTWLGSYPIPKLGGFFIHTALATTRGLAPKVSELVGWDNFPLPFVNHIWIDSLRIRAAAPAYSTNFSAYKWIKVGNDGSTYLADQGIDISAAFFLERPYWPPASNVFVSKALYAGGFTLTDAQYRAAGGGRAPLLNRCGIVAS